MYFICENLKPNQQGNRKGGLQRNVQWQGISIVEKRRDGQTKQLEMPMTVLPCHEQTARIRPQRVQVMQREKKFFN
jgi:hypothetical protein